MAMGTSEVAHIDNLAQPNHILVQPLQMLIFHSIEFKGYTSISHNLYIFFKNYQFEFHKLEDHWRVKWSLILGPIKLVEVYVSWTKHPC